MRIIHTASSDGSLKSEHVTFLDDGDDTLAIDCAHPGESVVSDSFWDVVRAKEPPGFPIGSEFSKCG